MKLDQDYMAEAIQLARRGLNTTTPNPRVGCVLVKDHQIIGRGFHHKAGEGHAEVNALADVKATHDEQAAGLLKGATAYVTLEPCSHFGRTPPCSQALIDHGIARVVSGMTDPNPQVAGNGLKMLQEAGIETVSPCLEADAMALNRGFIKRMKTGMPYVRIKLAISLDGRTAMQSGESQWITGPEARHDVQKLRAQSCAIITGADSVLIDNPSMTVRLEELGGITERQPLRILIDSQQRVPSTAKIFQQDGETRVISSKDGSKIDLTKLLKSLADEGHQEILVETGANLAGAFIEQKLVDELVVYCAPTLLGSSARSLAQLSFEKMNQQIRWQWQDVRMVGNDLRLTLTTLNPIQPSDKTNSKS